MNEPRVLVEHFFRHEYGRLVGLLTGALGVRHLELVEDVVQMALWRALHNWSRHGIPDEPAAWLYRTARNLATDALRRTATFERIAPTISDSIDQWSNTTVAESEIEDESLRLLFLCCHQSISADSQIALALKIVGGFSVQEIACALLVSSDTIEKRLARAKAKLREVGQELADLTSDQLASGREAVMHVLYLMFNEGFSASSGDSPIKRDLCDEAVRLTRMLGAQKGAGEQPALDALLALMLMHSARLVTRVDAQDCVVLLADQDRSQWDWHQIRQAMHWMLRAARGTSLTRYHIEAAIAWEHCRASSIDSTDWPKVVQLYDLLLTRAPSPMVRLNRIIAQSYAAGPQPAIDALLELDQHDRKQLRPWWDCTMAQLLERTGQTQQAISHWRDALALTSCTANRAMMQRKIDSMLSTATPPAQPATHSDSAQDASKRID